VAAAHYWNRKPSELGLCEPSEDPAVMLAYFRTSKSIEAWDAELQRKEMEKVKAKRKR
jgi:hypothetical protein